MARPALVETEELVAAKILARKQAMAARKVAKADAGPDAGQKLADHFQTLISPPAGTIISGFLSIGSEVDVAPTLSAMAGRGCQICLPCVIAPRTPLVFRLWKQGDALIEESFGTRAPAATATEVQPDILIVPLLSFDRAGYRLGYGGGFYDRTLEMLRKTKPVLAVGVAYSGQQVDAVLRGPYDQPLDWILMESGGFQPDREGAV